MKKGIFAVIMGLAIFSTVSVLTGCSGKTEAEKVAEHEQVNKAKAATFQFLEDQRTIATDNATMAAQEYRANNPRLAGMKIVPHTDSTISASCPSGDGWASLTMMDSKDGGNRTTDIEKIKIKCSTVSLNLGCYLEKDFENKPFAQEEGRCNTSLPSPLPKIGK